MYAPTALATRAGDPALYVAEQNGRVIAIRDGAASRDVRPRPHGPGARPGRAGPPRDDVLPRRLPPLRPLLGRDGATTVDEYAFTPTPGGGGTADRGSRRRLLTLAQPQPNHNGGQLAFGPDGVLYLGLGDGGSAGDQGDGHASGGNGQSEDTLLGKIVRVDVAKGGGTICDLGLRNPWRFSFDRRDGDLWIGDVGQDTWEEIDRLPANKPCGHNLGWNVFEGRARFRDGDVPDAVKPVAVTSHDDGNCSVIGGFVYRGTAIPALRGWYVFTDYCNGALRALRVGRDGTVQQTRLGATVDSPTSFGEDERGELYVLSQRDGVYPAPGAVSRSTHALRAPTRPAGQDQVVRTSRAASSSRSFAVLRNADVGRPIGSSTSSIFAAPRRSRGSRSEARSASQACSSRSPRGRPSPRRTSSFSVKARSSETGARVTASRTCSRAIPRTRSAAATSRASNRRLRCPVMSIPRSAMTAAASGHTG